MDAVKPTMVTGPNMEQNTPFNSINNFLVVKKIFIPYLYNNTFYEIINYIFYITCKSICGGTRKALRAGKNWYIIAALSFRFSAHTVKKTYRSAKMSEKVYIEVEVIFYPDGRLAPVSFVWEDERIAVEKFSGPTIMLSTKSGGTGVKYACQAQGNRYDLFFDMNRWYIIKE